MFKIGFSDHVYEGGKTPKSCPEPQSSSAPVRSVVQVFFPGRGRTLSYYNDMFDLRRGDIVYVDGKLEGLRGRMTDISYNFKIKLSDYKRIISVADTCVSGELHMAGSHFITFDDTVIPYEKILTWFRAPKKSDEEYASGSGGSGFSLAHLEDMNIGHDVAGRGHDYYLQNRVCYLCLDGIRGRAIVEGGKAYEIEFTYQNGEIGSLVCDCFCSYPCKHEFAAMLQLKEALELIEKNHEEHHRRTDYFAAISKSAFFSFAVDGKDHGSFTIG